jgi:hypothetical protein
MNEVRQNNNSQQNIWFIMVVILAVAAVLFAYWRSHYPPALMLLKDTEIGASSTDPFTETNSYPLR